MERLINQLLAEFLRRHYRDAAAYLSARLDRDARAALDLIIANLEGDDDYDY